MKLKNILCIIIFGCLSLLLMHCAQPGRLSGGPKDNTPPKLVAEESALNLQTNFQKQTIELTFDEWIKLENPFQQVVISPPLIHPPKIKLKGKTVRFEFHEEEILKPDATYTINFGESVKDITEGNIVKNLSYVFSTGDYIDSLKVRGKVVDVITNEAIGDALVMLYTNIADTVVRTERPFYFARTDKSGAFQVNNVKADTFKVFGLVDNNFNYLFDLETEKIAFQNDPIIISDTLAPIIQLEFFEEAVPIRLIKQDSSKSGKLTLIFNQPPGPEVNLQQDDIGQTFLYQREADSIHVWHATAPEKFWDMRIEIDTLIDTVRVKPSYRKSTAYRTFKSIKKSSPTNTNLNPAKSIQLAFNHPITQIDTSLIQITRDSLEIPVSFNARIDSTDQRTLIIENNWIEKSIYKLLILPNALRDIYQQNNLDSLELNYKALEKTDFGDITLEITDADSSKHFIFQLFFKQNNLVEKFSVAGDTSYTKSFKGLPPGAYSLQITEDRNANQKWDTGNYDRKEQPEKRNTRALEELRASWEVNSTISLKKF